MLLLYLIDINLVYANVQIIDFKLLTNYSIRYQEALFNFNFDFQLDRNEELALTNICYIALFQPSILI